MQLKFDVKGMSCAACSLRVQKAVETVSGTNNVQVNLLTNTMNVEVQTPEKNIINEICTAVFKAGYQAFPKSENSEKNQTGEKQKKSKIKTKDGFKFRLITSVGILLPLFYLATCVPVFNWPLPYFLKSNFIINAILQMFFCVLIMFINKSFFINGVKGLIRFSPNMDTLVAMGSFTSFFYSTITVFNMISAFFSKAELTDSRPNLYFESAAMILTFITMGKALEAFSKGKTTNAINALKKLAPSKALILINEKEKEIPVETLKAGDIFLVKPGESFPCDGIILEGSGAVNESALTGESLPVEKSVNDSVKSATINENGFFKCRATATGSDTILNRIISLVEDASASKAPAAKIADKVSAFFVPVIMIISIITFAVWMFIQKDLSYALNRAISVLVISCPCSLGLATPVSIMVGNGLAARHGILFKNAEALENAGRTKIVILDKTGTLTKGKPEVTDIIPFGCISKEELLSFALLMESKSTHPLASAIVEKAKELHIITNQKLLDFKNLPGFGIQGTLNGISVYAGNEKLISAYTNIPEELIIKSQNFSKEGKTPLFFLEGKNIKGLIAISD
ncbi:MAG: heavy metal translocating P-type ATPase, partial [Treponema sp.]|nr:heavy metal translocating P-type ATPase [Treponema sp.]